MACIESQEILSILQTFGSESARVENLSMPLLNMGDVYSLTNLLALLSQLIHFAFFTSFTLIKLRESNLRAALESSMEGPTTTLLHLASGTVTEPHYQWWIMV